MWIRWLNLSFWTLVLVSSVFRNAHDSSLRQKFSWIDKKILSPLAFYHRGWGMFPSITTGSSLNRVRYVYRSGLEEIDDFFPLYSSWKPSVWNEVMEDVLGGHDTASNNEVRRLGFLTYQCRTRRSSDQLAGPLKTIYFEHSFIPLYELFTNYGEPYQRIQYLVFKTYQC